MSQIDLDSINDIKKLDVSDVYGSVMALPDQCLNAWTEANKVAVLDEYKRVNKLVMTGMGGSGLAARLIESLYWNQLKVPMMQVHDYNLPGFVDENTLVVCCSYSGSTEETIENFHQAAKTKSKIMVVSTGGKLIELAKEYKIPYYQIQAKYNPSNQPRMAVGYTLVGQIALVQKCGLIDLAKTEIESAIKIMSEIKDKCKLERRLKENQAKQLARQMYGKIIGFVAAEHLAGALHTVKNQTNENAKLFSTRFDIPELNHHAMEGLKHPIQNSNDLFFFMVQSKLYLDRNQKRILITKDVIEKNHVSTYLYETTSDRKVSQCFEVIQLGSFVVFYLSMLYGINPAPIPWVDYFKEQLKK